MRPLGFKNSYPPNHNSFHRTLREDSFISVTFFPYLCNWFTRESPPIQIDDQCMSDIVIYATYTKSRFHRVKALTYLSSQAQCMMVLIRQLKSPYFSSKAEMKTGQVVSWTLQHLSAFPKPPRCVYLRAVCPFPHHFVPGTRNKSISSRFLLQGYDLSRLPCPALIASYWTASLCDNIDNKCLTNVFRHYYDAFTGVFLML
jgi:hypothetical protein